MIRSTWVKVLIAAVVLAALGVGVIDLAGGFAHPVFFGGLALAAGTFLAVVLLLADRVESYAWPEPVVAGGPQTQGTLELVRVVEQRMRDPDPQDRARSLDPVVREVVTDLLRVRHHVDLDHDPVRARALLSDDLAAVVGLVPGVVRSLEPPDLARLIDELERL